MTETIHTLADQLYNAIERRTRNNGEDFFCLKSDAPDWMTDVCATAHGDMMPDDYRYDMIRDAALWLSDDANDPDDTGDFADDVDIWNSELCDWLASHNSRHGYVDEAIGMGIADPKDGIMSMISAGQYMERQEVIALMVGALNSLADDDAA